MGNTLTLNTITSESQLNAIKTEWKNILEESSQSSPFLDIDWFRCCLKHFSDKRETHILTIWDGKYLIGITPLWRFEDIVRHVKIRKIGFITCPDTPYVDFIIAPNRREDVLTAVLQYLYNNQGFAWDMFSLSRWPEESQNYRALKEILLKQQRKFFTAVASVTPYIPINEEWDQFILTRSVKFKKTRRNIINRISKLKNVEIQCFRKDLDGTVFKDVLAVSEKSWKKKDGIAISGWKAAENFFDTLTDRASKRGWLLVWILKVDGHPIAMEYDLEHEGHVYALRADYDEAYKKYSPGMYLEYHIIKHLYEEGYREYNTGPGVNDYKKHWTDKIKENVVVHICNNNLKGLMIWGIENKVRPFLSGVRELKTRMRSSK